MDDLNLDRYKLWEIYFPYNNLDLVLKVYN